MEHYIDNSKWNKVAVVLVNYNDELYLERCLNSLYKQSYKDYTICIVDNGSKDRSLEKVAEKHPDIKAFFLGKNLGWGAGSNIGIKKAIENGSEYILLLNTDTEVEPDMLELLVQYAEPSIVTTPRMYMDISHKESSGWYSGGIINYDTAEVNQVVYKWDKSDKVSKKVSFVTGCCMLIHRDVFSKVKLFDEEYFLYYEDVDFSIRLLENNIEMLYIPKAGLWHKVGGSSGSEGISYISEYYTVRNQLFLVKKYKKYFKKDVIDVLSDILQKRVFFEVPATEKYQRYVMAGIEDFLKGIRGKENNRIFDYFSLLSGFYPADYVGDVLAHWAGRKRAIIEIRNPFKIRKSFCFSCWIGVPEILNGMEITISVTDQKIMKIKLPNEIRYEYCLEAGECKQLVLEAENQWYQNDDTRILSFQIGNLNIETISFSKE